MSEDGCTVNLLGGTCPVRSLCPVHRCTEEWCRCEDEPTDSDARALQDTQAEAGETGDRDGDAE